MSKILFAFFILTVYCTSFNEVLGKPKSSSLPDSELIESPHNIIKRDTTDALSIVSGKFIANE